MAPAERSSPSSAQLAIERSLLTVHLSLALEAGQMGTWEWDMETNDVAWSPTLERLVGLDEGTFEGTFDAFVQSVHPDDRERVLAIVERSVRERAEHHLEYRVIRRDGALRWLEARGRLVIDDEGAPRRLLGVCWDVTERKESMLRLQLSEAFHSATLLSVADAVVTTDPRGLITLMNGVAQELSGFSLEEARGKPLAEVIRFVDEIELGSEARALAGEREVSGLPQIAGGATGNERAHRAKILERRDGTRFYVDESTAPIRTTVGDVVGQVLVLREVTAERQEESRRRFISEASALLTSTLDFEKTMALIARLAVSRIADGCAVHSVLSDGTLRRLFVDHRDPAGAKISQEIHERFAPNPSAVSGAARVVRTGKSLFVPEATSEHLAKESVSSEHRELLSKLRIRAFMIVPLRAGARIWGAISLVACGTNTFDEEDLAMAEELGRRAGTAMENARLYEDAQHARHLAEQAAARAQLIQEVTAALSDAPTSTLVAEVATSLGSKAIGAAAVALFELSPSGDECTLVRSFGYPDDLVRAFSRIPMSSPTPLADAIKTGRPIFLEERGDFDARYPGLLQAVSAFRSWAALPLIVEGHELGGLGIGFAETRIFDDNERDFVITLSRLCAHALHRAKLFDSEQRARAEAESVRRARENLLTVVSHDLRNPLSAIATTASMLTKIDGQGKAAPKIAKCADNISRATYRMERLIADLLDLAKMESGRLAVEIEVHDVGNIVRESVDVLLPLAGQKELSLTATLPSGSVAVLCDRERVLQVLSNLIGNALKFTSPGGTISAVCQEMDDVVQISVSDNGCGIAEAEMPHIFERYWQAKTGVHDGIGLGLSIARGLIEAQGGKIWVESRIDHGTTFYFTLPLHRSTHTPPDTKIKTFVGL